MEEKKTQKIGDNRETQQADGKTKPKGTNNNTNVKKKKKLNKVKEFKSWEHIRGRNILNF